MVIDHIGLLFFPGQEWMQAVGRLTMPIFAYAIARGIYYTHNSQKYLKRLAILAIISQIPYTLLFGLGVTYEVWDKSLWIPILSMITPWALSVLFLKISLNFLIPVVLLLFIVPMEYTSLVILLPILVYHLWFKTRKPLIACVVATLILSVIAILSAPVQWFALLAIPLIALMEHVDSKLHMNKWFFYAFYPGHLLILLPVATFFEASGLSEIQ